MATARAKAVVSKATDARKNINNSNCTTKAMTTSSSNSTSNARGKTTTTTTTARAAATAKTMETCALAIQYYRSYLKTED